MSKIAINLKLRCFVRRKTVSFYLKCDPTIFLWRTNNHNTKTNYLWWKLIPFLLEMKIVNYSPEIGFVVSVVKLLRKVYLFIKFKLEIYKISLTSKSVKIKWMLSYLLWDVSVLIHWQAWPAPYIKLVNFKSSSIYHHLSALHKCISYLDRCWPIDFQCFSFASKLLSFPQVN